MGVGTVFAILGAGAAIAASATPEPTPIAAAELGTVAAIGSAVQKGGERCASIVAGHLAKIREQDERLRSVVMINPRAMRDAARLDRLRPSSRHSLPLLCAPLLVKDNIDVAGLATTGGSYALRNNVAARDAAVVAAARRAGAIVIAKTNMSQFALNFRGKSAVRGQTVSPFGVNESAGGSSSGNAAALAAGIGVIGLGTDTSGSLRVPAALTGTIGLRPTFGTVSTEGVMPLAPSQDTVGPMCRQAEDCRRLLEIIAPAGSGHSAVASQEALKGVRIGVLRDLLPSASSSPRMKKIVDQALAGLVAAGAVLTDVRLTDEAVLTAAEPPSGETALFMSRSFFDFPDAMDHYLPARRNAPRDFADLVKRIESHSREGREDEAVVEELRKIEANSKGRSEDPRARVNGPFRDLFVGDRIRAAFAGGAATPPVDLLLYPSVQDASFAAGKGPDTKGTHRLAAYSGYPAVSFPIGMTDDAENSRPVGIELLARPGEDRRLLAIVEAWPQIGTGACRSGCAVPQRPAAGSANTRQ